MAKFIKHVFKTNCFSLSECTDGYWMYDYIEGLNISMRAKTEQEACYEALVWYQKKYLKLKAKHKLLEDKVKNFMSQFEDENDIFN